MLLVEVGVATVGVDLPVADQRLGHGGEHADGDVTTLGWMVFHCLKRYIVCEIYRTITAASTLAPDGHELRERRHELQLPVRVVADATGTHISTVARLERGHIRDPQLATQIHAWLHQPQEPALAA